MASTKIPVTISYHKPDTKPPVYVAGSYSEPQWQPEEMDVETDDQGNHIFKKEFLVEPGFTAQYKFRLGLGDWWVVDEETDTTTDDVGNRNNILKAPENISVPQLLPKKTTAEAPFGITQPSSIAHNGGIEKEDKSCPPNEELPESPKPVSLPAHGTSTTAPTAAHAATPLDVEGKDGPRASRSTGKTGIRRLSTSPLPGGEETTPDVADSAGQLLFNLDHGSSSFAGSFQPDSGRATPKEEQCPLFSHECIGTYEYDDEENLSEEETQGSKKEPQNSRSLPKKEHNQYDLNRIDLDDPRLERFPSDRESILAAMRRLETSTTEDQTRVGGVSLSPVVSPRRQHSRDDLPSDVAVGSPLLESHGRLENPRLEVPRKTLGSMASDRSLSLHSISEELGESEEPEEARVMLPSPQWGSSSIQTLHSDDDEGVVMKVTRQQKADALDDLKQSESLKEELEVSPRTGAPDLGEPASNSTLPIEGTTGLNIENGDGTIEARDEDLKQDSPHVVVRRPEANHGPWAPTNGSTGHTAAAKSTSVDSGRDSQLTKRGGQNERPDSPTSARSVGKEVTKENFLRAFVRVLFVDWIGGLISRLCGSRRKA